MRVELWPSFDALTSFQMACVNDRPRVEFPPFKSFPAFFLYDLLLTKIERVRRAKEEV